MPLATDINGTWVWDYRSDAASLDRGSDHERHRQRAAGRDPPRQIEGWLKLTPPPFAGKAEKHAS